MQRNIYGKPKRDIAKILRDYNINPTAQRIEIAHFLLQMPQHLCAEEVLASLNKEYEQVSQATIYNNLRLFVARGLIRELAIGSDRVYYDSNTSAHHHFLDLETGQLTDLAPEEANLPEFNIDADIEEVALIIKGRRRK